MQNQSSKMMCYMYITHSFTAHQLFRLLWDTMFLKHPTSLHTNTCKKYIKSIILELTTRGPEVLLRAACQIYDKAFEIIFTAEKSRNGWMFVVQIIDGI